MGVNVGSGADLSRKGAIHVKEISSGEQHADDPSGEANFEAVAASFGIGDCE